MWLRRTRRASDYLQALPRDSLSDCSNPIHVVPAWSSCSPSRAEVGSLGLLAGAASSTRLVTRQTAPAARLRHREGATDQREGSDRP